MFVCVSVVRAIAKHPKAVLLILACNHTILPIFSSSVLMIICVFHFFLFFWSHSSVNHPIVDNGEARRGSYVAVVIIVSDK